ncbi:MAG: GNAT family N-acetyltransferase [Ghiorsea sp.]
MFKQIETEGEIAELVAMAHEIWSEHFSTMFDENILPQLIETAQSRHAMVSQMKAGYPYYFITRPSKKIGYFSYKINPDSGTLFLSKIYILSKYRGQSMGKKVLRHLENICQAAGVGKIALTVYHGNTSSIKAYEHWGFTNLGIVKRHFDNGMVFDDIGMEKTLT